jgi:hypothetical protein
MGRYGILLVWFIEATWKRYPYEEEVVLKMSDSESTKQSAAASLLSSLK